MVVAVLLALHHKLRCVPGQELNGVQGLHVFVGSLTIQFACFLPRSSVVGYQSAVVLLTVQLKHIDRLVIRTPTDVGEIAV